MKKISIYNNYSPNHQNKRNRITHLLKENGLIPTSNGDLVIVVGGDGTFLSAVKERYKDNPVFVGLNNGNLGFFSEYDFTEAKKFITMIANKSYSIVEYPIYQADLIADNGLIQRELFINDAVMERKSAKIIHLETKINGLHTFPFAADSLIVSSSLGSSAYNMSAGGSVFLENLPILQITPNAQLRSKIYPGPINPIVVNDNSTIEIIPNTKKKRPFRLVLDGKEVHTRNLQKVVISHSQKTFRILRFDGFDYTRHIKGKLF